MTLPPPEPDGLVRGSNRVQPRASSVPVFHCSSMVGVRVKPKVPYKYCASKAGSPGYRSNTRPHPCCQDRVSPRSRAHSRDCLQRVPREAYHAWRHSHWQEQRAGFATAARTVAPTSRALANREPVLCIDWHGVLDRGWNQATRTSTSSARAAILNFCQQNQPLIFAILSFSAEHNHWATGIGAALRDLESFLPEYISVLGAQCSARVGANGKARFSQTLRPHPPNVFIDDKLIIWRELRKTGAIVIQCNPSNPTGLQDDCWQRSGHRRPRPQQPPVAVLPPSVRVKADGRSAAYCARTAVSRRIPYYCIF